MNQTDRESLRDTAFEPIGPATRTANGKPVETALQMAIDLHGPGLLNRPEKLRLHLEAQCPQAASDISLLLTALDEHVPQTLLGMTSPTQIQTVLLQLQGLLAERRGLDPFAANWVVTAWAAALRMDLFGHPAPLPAGRPAGDSSAAGTPLPKRKPSLSATAERPEAIGTKTTEPPMPFSVPFGILAGSQPVADAGGPPTGTANGEKPMAPTAVSLATQPTDPDVASMPEPAAVSIPEPGIPADAPSVVPDAGPDGAQDIEPPVAAEATVPSAEIASLGVAQPVDPEAIDQPAAGIAASAAPPSATSAHTEAPVAASTVVPPPAPDADSREAEVGPTTATDDVPIAGPQAPPAIAPVPIAETEELPRWAATTAAAAAVVPQPFSPWWGVAGVAAAVAVAVAALRFVAPTDDPRSPPLASPPQTSSPTTPQTASQTASPTDTPTATQPGSLPAGPSRPPASDPAKTALAATPAPAIVDVVTDGTLVGDGAQHAVFVAIDPARRDVRSVEATFMSGAGAFEPRSRVIDVPPGAIQDGRIPVGPIGLRTTTPATATFQYVLTTADGTRSMPFVKQFAFTPVAARPPAIVGIDVPPRVAAGTPFKLTIDFTPGETGIASIERTTIGADEPPRVTSLAGLASPKEGVLRVPIEAIPSTSRTTFAFTLVDRDGTRSAPKQVVVETFAPNSERAESAPQRSEPVACTRATCGSIVSVREIDRSGTYEVIARMDDRTIRAIVAPTGWKVGTRVRGVGGRLVPVDAVAAPRPKARPRTPAPLLPESPPIFSR